MQKDRITVTLTPELVDRIDRLADLRDVSRSRLMERLLELAVEDEEKSLEHLASPVLGPIVQGIMEHPKIIAMIAKAIGERMDPEEIAQWEKAAPKIRKTRERLRDERGRRHDLRPEGA